MKLKRKKIGDQKYEMTDTATGEVIAIVVKTGSHLDDYPWDWYLRDGLDFAEDPAGVVRNVEESMKACVAAIEGYVDRLGLADQIRISAYDVQPGDRFRLGGDWYTSVGRTTGEFNPSPYVRNHRTGTEDYILIQHGEHMLTVSRPRKQSEYTAAVYRKGEDTPFVTASGTEMTRTFRAVSDEVARAYAAAIESFDPDLDWRVVPDRTKKVF